jgi:hypothetical protein
MPPMIEPVLKRYGRIDDGVCRRQKLGMFNRRKVKAKVTNSSSGPLGDCGCPVSPSGSTAWCVAHAEQMDGQQMGSSQDQETR